MATHGTSNVKAMPATGKAALSSSLRIDKPFTFLLKKNLIIPKWDHHFIKSLDVFQAGNEKNAPGK
jgi:hypothetical protein